MARRCRMGVEAGLFSPALRSPTLREQALCALGLDAGATLLVGVGRFSAEKRWDMVMRAVGEAARRRKVGLLLVGDGPQAAQARAARRPRSLRRGAAARSTDRDELARLLASADALVHGCEAETFCMVAAEARASGIPLIVPDRGAAVDQLVPGAGTMYRAASEISLERAIGRLHRPRARTAARRGRARQPGAHDGRAFRRAVRALRGACAAACRPAGSSRRLTPAPSWRSRSVRQLEADASAACAQRLARRFVRTLRRSESRLRPSDPRSRAACGRRPVLRASRA